MVDCLISRGFQSGSIGPGGLGGPGGPNGPGGPCGPGIPDGQGGQGFKVVNTIAGRNASRRKAR